VDAVASVANHGRRPTADDGAIRLEDVIRIYREGDVETVALRGVTLSIAPGEFVAIMGRSGSGKTTLLNLIAGSDRPSAGRVVVEGVDLSVADEATRATMRGRRIGVVYQSQNLVPILSLVENVALAAHLASRTFDRDDVLAALDQVGLRGRAMHRPDALSGGEQQRAALACVLAAGPTILLGDEITGELDSAAAALVLDAVTDTLRAKRTTVVLVTHDPDVAGRADRIVRLRSGLVVEERRPS
jgi:putative ABC transport system ATP-binding protein